MTIDEYGVFEDAADGHRRNRDNVAAGNNYSLAAHHAFALSKYLLEPKEGNNAYFSLGLQSLLSAALCYRLGDDIDRSRNRCEQGQLICEDRRDHVVEHEVQKALMNEIIGDFQMIGQMGEWEDFYDDAESTYLSVENPISWQAESEFEATMAFFLRVLKASDHHIDSKQRAKVQHESLTERIRYKRENFPRSIRTVLEKGAWIWEERKQ